MVVVRSVHRMHYHRLVPPYSGVNPWMVPLASQQVKQRLYWIINWLKVRFLKLNVLISHRYRSI